VPSGSSHTLFVANTSLCGSSEAALAYTNASDPAPPGLLVTMTGAPNRRCFWMIDWTIRANWSVPPPAPAATMNSTGRCGDQGPSGGAAHAAPASMAMMASARRDIGVPP
jgi:hypothetical protein